MTHKNYLKERRQEKVFNLVETLYKANIGFEPLIEDLHTIFISHALDETGADPNAIASYNNIRSFLRDAEKLYRETE